MTCLFWCKYQYISVKVDFSTIFCKLNQEIALSNSISQVQSKCFQAVRMDFFFTTQYIPVLLKPAGALGAQESQGPLVTQLGTHGAH